MFLTLVIIIFALAITSFAIVIVFSQDMDSYERGVCISTAISFFILVILTTCLLNVYYKDIEEYYRLGQQDAVNGNVYYDINPNKVLIEKKK